MKANAPEQITKLAFTMTLVILLPKMKLSLYYD